MRIDQDFQVSQKILDFAPVEKALSSNQMVTDARLPKRGFQRAGLLIGPKQDRVLRPGNAPGNAREFDFLDHRARLFLLIRKGKEADFIALALLRPKPLPASAAIVLNDRIGGREDRIRGTIVLFQFNHLNFRKVFFHVQQVGDVRSAHP